MKDVTQPLSNSIPVEKVCEKLKVKDAQICELKYGITSEFLLVFENILSKIII